MFGRGQEVQFFMTDKDHKTFLHKIIDKDLFFIRDYVHPTKNPIMHKEIPKDEWPTKISSKDWFIYKKDCGKLVFEYDSKYLKAYLIKLQYSPVIQFSRSELRENAPLIQVNGTILHKDVLTGGRIATFLSASEYDENRRKYEIKQSEEFIKWWEEVKKTLKKMCIKCYMLTTTNKRMSVPFWAGPDATRLYKEGVVFQQLVSDRGPMNTFHPEKLDLEELDK